MKVGVIARGLTKGGVTRVVKELLLQWNTNQDKDIRFIVFTDDKTLAETYPNLEVHFIAPTNKLIWDYFKVYKVIKQNPVDILLNPKSLIPLSHFWLPGKKVCIVHDLAYFEKKLNEYKLFDTIYMRLFLKISSKKADAIFAISDSTKNDLITRFGINGDKIKRIQLACGDKFARSTEEAIQKTIEKYKIQTPYIFYCGSLSPRKNILRVLQAFNAIKDKIPHNIYLSGGQSWNDADVLEYITTHLSDRVFRIGFPDDSELNDLYSGADLFLYVSLYEGFGLPILEAQTCGAPVITSNVTSCPEVAADSAEIVDPYDVHAIEDGMLKVLTDEKYRNELQSKGYKNIKRFSWEKTAQSIIQIIKTL